MTTTNKEVKILDIEGQKVVNGLPVLPKKSKDFLNDTGLIGGPLSVNPLYDPSLYVHQKEAIDSLISHRIGILKMATGTGKTRIMGELCSKFSGVNHILIVVPTINLLDQTKEALTSYLDSSITIDRVGDGSKKDIWAKVTIGLPQSLIKVKGLELIQVALFDECHSYINKTGLDCYRKLTALSYVCGLSATPLDDWDEYVNQVTVGMFGPVIYEFNEVQAIQSGVISQPRIEMHRTQTTYINNKFINRPYNPFIYNQQVNALIINNSQRNSLIVKLVASSDPTVIIVNKINTEANNHGFILFNLITTAYPNKKVYMANSKKGVKEGLDALRNDKDVVVIAGPNILSKGTDVPALGLIVIACAGSSSTDLIQRVGRVLRNSFGKTVGRVIDFIDSQGWMANQSMTRLAKYRETYGADNVSII